MLHLILLFDYVQVRLSCRARCVCVFVCVCVCVCLCVCLSLCVSVCACDLGGQTPGQKKKKENMGEQACPVRHDCPFVLICVCS